MKDVDGTPRYHCVVVARDISGEEKKCPCIEYSNNGQDNKCEVCQHLAVFHAPKIGVEGINPSLLGHLPGRVPTNNEDTLVRPRTKLKKRVKNQINTV